MQKVWAFIQKWILGAVEGPVLNAEQKFLDEALEKFAASNPSACNALVAGLYPFIDTVVENMAKQTATTYDDDEVALVKKELEDFATRHGFTLSNLDNDKVAATDDNSGDGGGIEVPKNPPPPEP